jgi:hypothetical protein
MLDNGLADQGEIGYLLEGQSGCREQPISAQGCLERVLQVGTRSLPWHCLIREQGSLLHETSDWPG